MLYLFQIIFNYKTIKYHDKKNNKFVFNNIKLYSKISVYI
jgi:hypothetical protein